MKSALLSFALLSLAWAPGARGDMLLYDNTIFPTPDTELYSAGPYVALGDQVHLLSAGAVDQASVEMFNNGGAGTFDAELDIFDVGSPVGALLGSFDLANINTAGGDVLDFSFNLGGLAVPQDLIFTVSVSNENPSDVNSPLDLGLDMDEPPTVGSVITVSLIAATSGPNYFELGTNSENVYFQMVGTPITTVAPETSSLSLLGTGLLVVGIGARRRRA